MAKKAVTIEDLAKLKTYAERYRFDVKSIKGLVENKQGFSYISWAYAEQIGNLIWDDFEWHPLINEKDGSLVHGSCVIIQMKAGGKMRSYSYPIIDHGNSGCRKDQNGDLRFWKNKKKGYRGDPDTPAEWKEYVSSFDINNAQMRGMSKLFSMMSGIGLSMFTGEDLTIYDQEEPVTPKAAPQAQSPSQPTPQAPQKPKYGKAKATNMLNNLPPQRLEKMLAHYKVDSVASMSTEQLQEAFNILTK